MAPFETLYLAFEPLQLHEPKKEQQKEFHLHKFTLQFDLIARSNLIDLVKS